MNLLLDSQILLWVAFEQAKVPRRMQAAIGDPANTGYFSVASIWELSIKYGSGGGDLPYNPRVLRGHLLRNGYGELPVTGDHALRVGSLPPLHKDPFDRILIAQAQHEGLVLLTVDWLVRQYPDLELF